MLLKLPARIDADLQESRIDWAVIGPLIPIAFITFLFHGFGDGPFGELMGNDMALSLNKSTPKGGDFINESHALWSAIGGPAFTVSQTLLFLLITWITESILAHLILYSAMFSRFFWIFSEGSICRTRHG